MLKGVVPRQATPEADKPRIILKGCWAITARFKPYQALRHQTVGAARRPPFAFTLSAFYLFGCGLSTLGIRKKFEEPSGLSFEPPSALRQRPNT